MKTVLCLDLEPRRDIPDFRGPHRMPAGTAVTSVKAFYEAIPAKAEPFSHVVLSGSTCSITKDNETTARVIALVRDAVARGVPLMGVCYGHQMIARALLGAAHVRRAAVPEFGWLPIRWDERGADWFGGLPNPFRVFVGHFDEVCGLPVDWQVLANSDACGIHAYVNEERRVLGVQFHPELDLVTGNACFALDAAELAPHGADMPRILRESADDGSGDMLFRRFLAKRWRARA